MYAFSKVIYTLPVLVLLTLFVAAPVRADSVIIDTKVPLNLPPQSAVGIGASRQIIGQVFRAPLSATLLYTFTLSFFVGPGEESSTFRPFFTAHIAPWDGTKATDFILYSSSLVRAGGPAPTPFVETFTFLTGGVNLTAGRQYVAYLRGFGGTQTTTFNFPAASTYSDGSVAISPVGEEFSQDWSRDNGDLDIPFQATFFPSSAAPIPEPATMILLGTGLAGIGGMARRRRQIKDK